MALSEDEVARLTEILAILSEVRGKLNSRSREFFDDVEKRYEQYGSEVRLSSKQWAWLESMVEQYA